MCLCCFMVNFLVYSSMKCSELNITKYHQKFLSFCRVSSNLTLLFTLSTSLPYLLIAYASSSIFSLQILPLIRLLHSLFLLILDCYHYFLSVQLPFFIICLKFRYLYSFFSPNNILAISAIFGRFSHHFSFSIVNGRTLFIYFICVSLCCFLLIVMTLFHFLFHTFTLLFLLKAHN